MLGCSHLRSYDYWDRFYNATMWECPDCGAFYKLEEAI
jgi:hypothetical protein